MSNSTYALEKWGFDTFGDRPLEDRLAIAVGRTGLDSALVDAYHPDTDALYTYPGMDNGFPEAINTYRRANLTHIVFGCEDMQENNPLGTTKAQEREGLRDMSRMSKRDRLHALEEQMGQREWLSRLGQSRDYGLRQSKVIRHVSRTNVAHYCFESEMPNDESISNWVTDRIVAYAFPEGYDERSLTVGQLSGRLRKMGVVDLSKDLLDSRFHHFTALAQLEATGLFAKDLRYYQVLGSMRQAHTLAQKYKEHMLANDYEVKIQMSQDLSAAYRQAAHLENDSLIKNYLGTFSIRSHATAETLISMREGFKPVYENLGYALPPELSPQKAEPALPVSEEAIVVRAKKPVVEQTDIQRAETRDYIDNLAKSITARIDAFRRSWQLSGKQRRGLGIDGICSELVKGFSSFSGEQSLPPISKTEAQELGDCLAILHRIAVDGAARQGNVSLNQLLAEQVKLQEDCLQVKAQANEAGVPYVPPPLPGLVERVTMFRDNWPTYRQLILKAWPHNQGAEAAQRLENLLAGIVVVDS